ncbi:MAG: pantetheine-phosphate adenylyltransferase [Dehalococcoidales bacterium]
MTVAVYPGSFDPMTKGHLDVVIRAARLFEKLIVGVYDTPDNKRLLFTVQERTGMAAEATAGMPNVEVRSFSGLTVDFAEKVGAHVMVRGLRVSADFEWEFDMAMMNRKLNPNLEMVCLMASPEFQFLSSSLLKEVSKLGGNVDDMLPKNVAEALRRKVHKEM